MEPVRDGSAYPDPLSITFDYLARSRNASALRILAAALEEGVPAIQQRAAAALLMKRQMAGLKALIRAYHTIPGAREVLIERFEWLIPALRESIRDEWAQARENAVDLIALCGGPRLAYLLTQVLADPAATVRQKAAKTLLSWAREVGAAWTAGRQNAEDRPALVGPRNALLASLWEAFRTFDAEGDPLLIAALIHLDPVQLALALERIRDEDDPRLAACLSLVRTTSDPAVVRFIYALLEHPLLWRQAVAVIAERRDRAFIEALLDGVEALDKETVQARLRAMPRAAWLDETSADLASLEPARLAALVRFAGAVGLDAGACSDLLRGLMARASPEARRGLVIAAGALPEEAALELVTAGLLDQDEGVQMASAQRIIASQWVRRNRLLLECVNSPFESVRHLAIRELSRYSFRRYLAAFDRLDETTRELAGRVIQRIDERMLDQLADELHALEAERRFRALRVIQTLNLEAQMAPRLIELLADRDRVVRATAVKILGVVRTLESVQAITEALNDPDARVQANAVEVVGDMQSPQFMALLTPFLRHPGNRVRANAARALIRLDYAPARTVLLEMLDDPAERMRLSAAWTLGQVRLPGVVVRLERMVLEDPSPRVRTQASETIERLRAQTVGDEQSSRVPGA